MRLSSGVERHVDARRAPSRRHVATQAHDPGARATGDLARRLESGRRGCRRCARSVAAKSWPESFIADARSDRELGPQGAASPVRTSRAQASPLPPAVAAAGIRSHPRARGSRDKHRATTQRKNDFSGNLRKVPSARVGFSAQHRAEPACNRRCTADGGALKGDRQPGHIGVEPESSSCGCPSLDGHDPPMPTTAVEAAGRRRAAPSHAATGGGPRAVAVAKRE